MRFFVSLTLLFFLSLPGCGSGGSTEPIDESTDSAEEMTDEEVSAEDALENGDDGAAESGDDTDI